MSHIIYQTEGIILRKSNFGEADRVLTIFTEKFGKISAVAQGVRYLKSKLRYNLETMSRSRIGLVASKKTDWRIIDAEEIDNYRKIIESPENLAVFSRIFKLFDRMIQGEEKNIFLWNKIKNIAENLSQNKMAKKELDEFETRSIFEVLKNLGYIDIGEYKNRREAITVINKAIKESML
ncbi:MAG: DNA repair protein RecO [Patescibacteria group bacterium]